MKLSAIIFATVLSLASAQTLPSASASASASSASHSIASSSLSPSSAQSASPSSAQSSPSPASGTSSGASGGAIISVTAPLQGASYKAGDKAIISWINPTVETISQIVLAKGGSNSLQPVTTIATNVPAASGSYTWNIPADLAAGADYAFEFGTSPNLAFTGQFTITGGTGGSTTTNSSVPVAGSGTSPASPASGSSSLPSSGLPGSSSGATQGSPSSSAANSLTAGSMVFIGAVVIGVAQVF